MIRVRITYAKTVPLRYTSNLDIHRIWERTLRRAMLPLTYSQGFHPQPRLNQACPLPLGLTSRCEILDIWLNDDLDLSLIGRAIVHAAPPGIELRSLEKADLQEPALQTRVVSADYEALVLEPMAKTELDEKIASFLAANSLPRLLHEKKAYDLRPLVLELSALEPDMTGRLRIGMQLSASEGATGRADEVVAALGISPFSTRIERVALALQQTQV